MNTYRVHFVSPKGPRHHTIKAKSALAARKATWEKGPVMGVYQLNEVGAVIG